MPSPLPSFTFFHTNHLPILAITSVLFYFLFSFAMHFIHRNHLPNQLESWLLPAFGRQLAKTFPFPGRILNLGLLMSHACILITRPLGHLFEYFHPPFLLWSVKSLGVVTPTLISPVFHYFSFMSLIILFWRPSKVLFLRSLFSYSFSPRPRHYGLFYLAHSPILFSTLTYFI